MAFGAAPLAFNLTVAVTDQHTTDMQTSLSCTITPNICMSALVNITKHVVQMFEFKYQL